MDAAPRPTVLYIMDTAEGAAVLTQIDAMIKALDGFDQPAVDAGDMPVVRLITRLYEAREAADEITRRPQPNEKSRGVSLRRR